MTAGVALVLVAIIGFVATALGSAFANLFSADVEQWLTSGAKWAVRRYVAKWPAARAERMLEECLAGLADTHGIVHIVMFAVGLWWGTPVETPPAETPARPPVPTKFYWLPPEESANRQAVVIEVPTATVTVSAPALSVNLHERLRSIEQMGPRLVRPGARDRRRS